MGSSHSYLQNLDGVQVVNLSEMIGHDEKAKYSNGMLGATLNPNALQNLSAPYIAGNYYLQVNKGDNFSFPAGTRFEHLYIEDGNGKFTAKEADVVENDNTYNNSVTIDENVRHTYLINNSVFNKGLTIAGLL